MMNLSSMSPYELGLTGRKEATPLLINFLKHGSSNEKRLAASAIGKLSIHFKDSCNKAIPALLACLELSDQPQTRQYALKTLSKINLPFDSLAIIQNIIELNDEHIKYLDDCLPKFLLKYDISVL
jgi:HEAT repeat protein